MKIQIKWTETTEYEAVIEVPDNYPTTVDDWSDADNETAPVLLESTVDGETIDELDGEDWFQRLNHQVPKWYEQCFASATDRELLELDMVDSSTKTGQVIYPPPETNTAGATP